MGLLKFSEVCVSRISRKDLKTDSFALEVEQTFSFIDDHRRQLIQYGAIGLAVVLLIVGWFYYNRSRHTERATALSQAMEVQQATVGQSATGGLSFPTEDARSQAAAQAFNGLQQKYPGSQEGWIGQFYLAGIRADQGKLDEAEKIYSEVAAKADAAYSSLAKLALSQIYAGTNRGSQGEQLLRELIAKPTLFVSKDQATIALARVLMKTQPEEAKKLLEPLRTKTDAAGQVALTIYGELASASAK
jgi:predicted negative regulator of RcsB-dependent stress response